MKVIINNEGKYLASWVEPFPSFTDDENDVSIYLPDSIATIIAKALDLKTLTKNFNDTNKKCLRCEHKWTPRKNSIIRICPKCKSPYWNKVPKIHSK